MNLDRTDDEVDITLPNSSTKCKWHYLIILLATLFRLNSRSYTVYGYDGIILEVTESSEVVSVTLF